jgi:hypothetical protein
VRTAREVFMELSFGARLRAHRERQQVSLEAIAAATKIKTSLLEELEADNVRHWPGGVFRRSFMRDYARAIGLDPEPIVAEFLARYPDPIALAEAEAAAARQAATSARSPEARVKRFFSGLLQRSWIAPEPDSAPAWVPPVEMHAEADDADEAVEEIVHVRVVQEPAREAVSLTAVADLCTRLARVLEATEVVALLAEASQMLEATGLIIWAWDPQARVLAPSLAHGYAGTTLQRMPGVAVEARNAIADAFRSAEATTVEGGANRPGALVVPMPSPSGCVGVVSLEVRDGRERQDGVRAALQILAAQLAAILDMPQAQQATA